MRIATSICSKNITFLKQKQCFYERHIFQQNNVITQIQGWEFTHRFSERIARFLPKNERVRDSRNKMSDSLIRSFLVSDLSNLLTSLIFGE